MGDIVNIKKILSHLLTQPMIVETGTDGIWKWRKWSDGIAECWGRTPVKTYSFTAQSGNGYYVNDSFALPTGLFSTVDSLLSERAQGTGSTAGSTLITIDGRVLDTTTAGIWVNSASSGSQSLSISLYVKGTWDNTVIDLDQIRPFYFQVENKTQIAQVGFKAAEASAISSSIINPPTIDYNNFTNYQPPTLQYSYDGFSWYSYTLGNLITIGGTNSDIVYFRGDNLAQWHDKYEVTTTQTVDEQEQSYTSTFFRWTQAIIQNNCVKSGGNIMSLRYKDFAYKKVLPCNNAFRGLFYKCTNLIQPPILPATTLTDYCYSYMFYESGITSAPILQATTMKPYCYAGMLSRTHITYMPQLPATTLADYCYGSCTPPDSIDDGFRGMFCECYQLVSISNLPATTLATGCYSRMFASCTALEQAPSLPATNLAVSCYEYMFYGCLKLTSVSTLPATTMKDSCYEYMFTNCKALTTAPSLPAMTLASSCYKGMFAYTSITKTPALPATTLANSCYGTWIGTGMFEGCTQLTSITKLPALTIDTTNAYYGMFRGSNVKASATATSECSYAYRVPTSGTGTADSKSLTDMFTDASGSGNFTPTVNTTFYINVPSF